jgi:hypothetical protein
MLNNMLWLSSFQFLQKITKRQLHLHHLLILEVVVSILISKKGYECK